MDRQGVSNRDMAGITAPQQTFFSEDLNPERWESRKVHPLIKRLFLSKSIPDVPLAETFCRSLDDYFHLGSYKMFPLMDPNSANWVTGAQNFGHSKRIQNPISFETISVKNPFPTNSESYIPYCYFKMEVLQNLEPMLQKGDYMCKLDLKDAYFSVPLEKNLRQFVRFRW